MSSPLPTETVLNSQLEGEPQAMSAEELRAHLYRSLQAKGVLSQLKSQLRCRLVQELRRHGSRGEDIIGATPPVPLALQVANSIVAEHLRGCGYEYSLSTFLPESHTSLDKLFSRADVLHYLQLMPPSPLHTTFTNDSGKGFLRDLLESLSAVLGGARCNHTHSTGVQTEEGGGGATTDSLSLSERLRALDEHHVAQLREEEGEGSGDGGGEMMEGWRRECEEQMRKQMNREMEQFRERELSQAREEERMRCEAELHNLRIEQENKHQKKMESIRRMELDTIDRLRRKEMESEAGLHVKRQELEQQLQVVGGREAQLQREVETSQQAIGLAEQRVTMAMEQLAAREREVTRLTHQQEAALQEREKRYSQECELQLEGRRAELVRWEGQLREEQGRQVALQEELCQAREQVKEERERREGVEGSLHETTRQLVELQRQKEDMQKALDKMPDHSHLNQQLSDLRAHVSKTERKLSENRAEHRRMQAEQQEVIKGLRRQLGHPNNNQLRILEEAEQVKRECHLKLTEAEREKRYLKKEVAQQAGVIMQQRGQLEEQGLALRGLQREVEDLAAQLAHLQTALLHSRQRTIRHGKPFQPPSHLPSPPTHPLTHPPPSTCNPPHTDPSSLMLSETKSVFVRLEQEAAELEKHYQQFHQCLTSDSLPPAPSSSSPPPLTTPHISTIPSTSATGVLPSRETPASHHTPSIPPTSHHTPSISRAPQTILDHNIHTHSLTPLTSQALTTTTAALPLRPSAPPTATSLSLPTTSGVTHPSFPTTHLHSNTHTVPSAPLYSSSRHTDSVPPHTSSPHYTTGSAPPAPHSTQPQGPRVSLDQLWKQQQMVPTMPSQPARGGGSVPHSAPLETSTARSQPAVVSVAKITSAVETVNCDPPPLTTPPLQLTTPPMPLTTPSLQLTTPPLPLTTPPPPLPHLPNRREEIVGGGRPDGMPHTQQPHSPTASATVTTITDSSAMPHTPHHSPAASSKTTVPTTGDVATSRGVLAEAGEGVDPLMVRYMELVRQRREEGRERGEESGRKGSQQSPKHSQSEHSHDCGLQPLCHSSDSVGVFSEPEQDPFQDW